MQKNKSSLIFWSGIIGNSLDHYDIALYAYMAPFIAPIFFKAGDPVVELIIAYGLMSTALFTRPIGGFIFGKMAMNHGAKRTLVITLAGVSLCTFALGFVPGYDDIGTFAPVILVLIRMTQGIFASGEHAVSSLFIMNHVEKGKYGRASSYYLISTMFGMMVASYAATLVSKTSNPGYYWRYPFFIGIITGFVGVFLRYLLHETPIEKPKTKIKSIDLIKVNVGKLLRIVLVSSFSFMTYSVPFVFFNSFIPLLQPHITKSQMLEHNTILLLIDVAMLPIFGFLTEKFPYGKWMATMSMLLCVTIIPLFYLLPDASMPVIIAIRLWIIILGVAFVAPLKAWFFKMLSGNEKYLVLGIGYAIGTEFFGRSITAISLSLWHYFNNSLFAPSLYIAFVSLATTIALLWKNEEL